MNQAILLAKTNLKLSYAIRDNFTEDSPLIGQWK